LNQATTPFVRKKTMKIRFLLLAFAFTASIALAGGGWHRVGDFDAGGDAKEAGVNRNCSKALVKVTDGSVIINTVVVREKDKATPFTIGARLEKGEDRVIELGGERYVTGLRVSDDGRGHYQLFVK
jgi:hypothetical protein